MSGIAADNVEDRLKIGFAIGAGCLAGAPKQEIIMSVCELLLASGYTRQYDFAKYLFDDLDLSVKNDLTHRYETFIRAVIDTRNRCSSIFVDLKFHFAGCYINNNTLRDFITKCERKKIIGQDRLLNLFIAINECLIHFETCAQIRGMFSSACIEHIEQMDTITDAQIEILILMLNSITYGYRSIEYPLDITYNKPLLELEIKMPNPYNVGTRAISYRPLVRCLENIESYRRRALRIILGDVTFDEKHYECLVNLKRILRRFNIYELQVNFACQNIELMSEANSDDGESLLNLDPLVVFAAPLRDDPLIRSEPFLRYLIINLDPWLRRLIITRILSITTAQEIEFPYVAWWRSQYDSSIRAVKLEENALYSPLLPIFDSVTSQRRENSPKLLNDLPQKPAVNKLLRSRL
jgi:hypothetical protein